MADKYYCYICDSVITEENKSDEHIILNAIGGHLHSYKVLCKDCNNRIGGGPDAKLAEDLSFFTDMLRVSKNRQNQHNQVMTDDEGHEIIVKDAGRNLKLRRPYINVSKGADTTTVNLAVRDKKELKAILDGLVKKGEIRHEDADAIMSKAEVTDHHPTLRTSNSISPEAFPSIIKSAVNLYVDKTGDVARVKHLVPYIEGKGDSNDVLYLHHFKELPYKTDRQQVTHMIHIEGSKETGLLYAMMEYFSIFVYIVVIDDNYSGKDINMSYSYDVVSSKEIERDFSCKLTLQNLEDFKNQPHEDYVKYLPYIQQRADDVLGIWESNTDKEMLHEIVNQTFSNYPEGCVITQNIIDDLEDNIMKFYEDKILRSFKLKKK